VNTQAPSEPETDIVSRQAESPPAETNQAASNTDKEPPLSVAKSLEAPAPKAVTPPSQKVATATPKVTPPPAAPKTRASAPPAQLGAKVVTNTEAAPTAHTAPVATGGSYVLQIGAYKSEAEADTAWKTYSSKHGGTLSGYSKDVKQVDLGAKGTWYRLRVGSFADKNAAAALCAKLTAEGGACFPAK
jgi:cell division septation protein DedD